MRNKKQSTSGENGKKETISWHDQYITEQPTKAVAAAAGTGFLLTFLPVGKIVGMLINLAFALVRPLLLGFGLVKLFDYCRPAGLCGGESEKTKQTNNNP